MILSIVDVYNSHTRQHIGYRIKEVVGENKEKQVVYTIEWPDLFQNRTTAKLCIERTLKVKLNDDQWKNLDYGATFI